MCAFGQPARCRATISLRPWTVVRALPWDTGTSEQVLGLRQATPHSEVLLRSSPGRHQRPGPVHLGARAGAAEQRPTDRPGGRPITGLLRRSRWMTAPTT